MVMRKASELSQAPSSPTALPDLNLQQPRAEDTVQASLAMQQTQQDLASLSLGDDNEAEESSDWDASDREEDDASKMVDDRPAAARSADMQTNVSRPHLAEDQIPESLRVKRPSFHDIPSTTPRPLSNEPSYSSPNGTLISDPHVKPNTNPFRRPSDIKTLTLDDDPMLHLAVPGTVTASDGSADLPKKLEEGQKHEGHDLATISAPLAAIPSLPNPWSESQNDVPGFAAPSKPPSAPVEDNSYMADLIDLGSGEPEKPEDGLQQIPRLDGITSSKVATAISTPTADSGSQLTPLQPTETQGLSAPVKKQPTQTKRNEFYQIKNIRWYDAKCKMNPRQSPILIQNANGPCPLLALVNALSLSTPPNLNTALIETLRTRETVSLGLLLDAVFDELMSGRRGATAQELPDVGELYSFLVTLHTGMNVNPRFVPDANNATFDQTKEMLLYSTFDIPLVHGWTPNPQEAAYGAFKATAESYEDAQNVQFREDELEQKLGQSELTAEEETVLRDLPLIKQFLGTWPTQLTEHGLLTMNNEIELGHIVILFRNDHFSTVYKEPKSGQLMTLVTDAGYSSHAEIVWESLVDINGAKSELYSGDFRSVSHGGTKKSSSQSREWQTVRNKRSKQLGLQSNQKESANPGAKGTKRTAAEQEDADLALALQLQEEEEHREREEQAARRREERLSENYLGNESARRGPQIPPRGRRNPSQTQQGTDELPSYEQAASERRYRPPPGHPSSEHVPTTATYAQATAEQRPGMGRIPTQNGLAGRRRGRQGTTPFDGGSGLSSSQAIADRREGCTIM